MFTNKKLEDLKKQLYDEPGVRLLMVPSEIVKAIVSRMEAAEQVIYHREMRNSHVAPTQWDGKEISLIANWRKEAGK